MTTHGAEATSLDGLIAGGDLLSGLIALELPGDHGWHGANSDPLDKLPAFTDDAGIRLTGLTGLLNDFPGPGNPTKSIQYDLGGLKNIAEIQILSGNNFKDGRVFSTVLIGVAGVNSCARSAGLLFTTLDRDLFLPPDSANLLRCWKCCLMTASTCWSSGMARWATSPGRSESFVP
jgi:hypothetical protein